RSCRAAPAPRRRRPASALSWQGSAVHRGRHDTSHLTPATVGWQNRCRRRQADNGRSSTTMKAIVALAALAAAMTLNSAQAQDPAAGERAKSLVGPELNGLDGRKAGSVPDFNYSDANKSSGIVWNETTFKDYIKDPRAKIPKTKM